MMVTSSTNKLRMEHDYRLIDWEAAGLANPSIARIDRIAAIPVSHIGTAGMIGKLTRIDINAIDEIPVKIEDEKKPQANPEA